MKFKKKKFNHGLRAAVANTDEHGWGRGSSKGHKGRKGREGRERVGVGKPNEDGWGWRGGKAKG